MYYLACSIFGSMICVILLAFLTRSFDNVRGYIIIFIGIPLGALLGLLTVKMIKNDSTVIRKSIITVGLTALLHFTGGLIGSAGGFVVCNLLVHTFELSWGGQFNILGIFIGGVLGILLVKKISSG